MRRHAAERARFSVDDGIRARQQIAFAPPGAVGGTGGDFYLTQADQNLVDVFAASGEYRGQLTESKEGADASGAAKPLSIPVGVGVDAAGAVYLAGFDGVSAGEVHKYEPTSNAPFAATNVKNFAQPSFGHVAAGEDSTAGSIFASGFIGAVAKLDNSSGAEECLVLPGESVALAVNGEDGHLLNATEAQVTEYEAGCAAEAEPRPAFTPAGAGAINGIAVDGSRNLVYVSREGSATIEAWEIVKVPDALTLAASPIGSTSATLRGEVNPNGQPLSECFFEWGETAAYGNIAPCTEPDAAEVGEGSSPVQVHAEVVLQGGSTYHFQLVVGNANTTPGEGVEGGDRSFQTLGPRVADEEAFEATASTAQVAAQVNPNGEATSFFVEYLTAAQYEANPEADRFAGAARSPARSPTGRSPP